MVGKKQSSDTDVEKFSSQLAAKIWGHRFTDGQRGPEYVLEFLNVLAGAGYDFTASKYKRYKSLGLRKFIFEGVKEGSKRDLVKLDEEDRKKLVYCIQSEDTVDVIRDFLRNLEVPLYDAQGKEADRSWYARTLYPLHESLLFFEVRKKGDNIGFERNFFARGGELYFLMLFYGTKDDKVLQESIEKRFKQLLTKNVPIEKIVESIQTALTDDEDKDDFGLLKVQDDEEKSSERIPYLPNIDHPYYKIFAKELSQLIKVNLDIYELFPLLTSLINFQLMRYMYDQAKISDDQQVLFFFDCLDGQEEQILKISSNTFQKNELLIKDKFEAAFKEIFNKKIPNEEFISENLEKWKNDPDIFLELMGLSKLKTRKQPVIRSLKTCKDYKDVQNRLYNVVKDVVSDQLKRHQLGIIKILARDGGIGGYRAGTKYRYFMSDNFLQALVFISVGPKETMEFSGFLDHLYNEYNFVIGRKAARESGLYSKSNINISYFSKNENALREKLKKNGLLIEYSDATAMIRNPYELVEV